MKFRKLVLRGHIIIATLIIMVMSESNTLGKEEGTATETKGSITTEIILEDFEDISNWGTDGNGTLGIGFSRSTIQLHDDAYTGRLTGDFSLAGVYKYVKISRLRPWEIRGNIEKFSLWVYGDGSRNNLALIFFDNTGEEFSLGEVLGEWTGWKKVEFPFETHSKGGRGGNADGNIDYPIKFGEIVLICHTKESAPISTIYFDNLTVIGRSVEVVNLERLRVEIPQVKPVPVSFFDLTFPPISINDEDLFWRLGLADNNFQEFGNRRKTVIVPVNWKEKKSWKNFPGVLEKGEKLSLEFSIDTPVDSDCILQVKFWDVSSDTSNLLLAINENILLPFHVIGLDKDPLTPTPGLEALIPINKRWIKQGVNRLILTNLGEGFVVLDFTALKKTPEFLNLPRSNIIPLLGFNFSSGYKDFTPQEEEHWLAAGCLPGGVIRASFYWHFSQSNDGKWFDEESGYYNSLLKGVSYWRSRGLEIQLFISTYPECAPEFAVDSANQYHLKIEPYKELLTRIGKDFGRYVDCYQCGGELCIVQDYSKVSPVELKHGRYYTTEDYIKYLKVTAETLRQADKWDADSDGQAVKVNMAAHLFLLNEGDEMKFSKALNNLVSVPGIGKWVNEIHYDIYNLDELFSESVNAREIIQKASKKQRTGGVKSTTPIWIAECGALGQGDGKISGRTWEMQAEWYRALPSLLSQLKGIVKGITFFTLNSDDWGIIGWGGYVGEKTRKEYGLPGPYSNERKYICLTPAWNKYCRPYAIAYTMNGPMVPCLIDSEEVDGIVGKAVIFNKNNLILAFTNLGKKAKSFKAKLIGNYNSIDYYQPYMGLLTNNLTPQKEGDYLIFDITLKPGESLQYVLRGYRYE